MNCTSIRLLFQSPDALMVDTKFKKLILNFKFRLLEQLEQAIVTFFINKDLTKFDPHVGENSCQIRACQVLDLIDDLPKSLFLKATVNKRIKTLRLTMARIKEVVLSLEKNTVIKRYANLNKLSHETLSNFLKNNGCICDLAEYEVFLFHAYILSSYKKVNGLGDTCIDYTRLQDELKVTKTMSEKIVHTYQFRLAEWSCEYVKKLTEKSKDLLSILNQLEFTDDDGRKVLPLFLLTQILVENLISKRKSIVVFVERRYGIHYLDTVPMLFISNGKDFTYHELNKDMDELSLDKPSFFVFGTVVYQTSLELETKLNYILRFNKVGILDILMANMAIHPQYSGHKLIKYKDNPYDNLLPVERTEPQTLESLTHVFSEKKELAIKYGCSKNNTDLLFIRHILCYNFNIRS